MFCDTNLLLLIIVMVRLHFWRSKAIDDSLVGVCRIQDPWPCLFVG